MSWIKRGFGQCHLGFFAWDSYNFQLENIPIFSPSGSWHENLEGWWGGGSKMPLEWAGGGLILFIYLLAAFLANLSSSCSCSGRTKRFRAGTVKGGGELTQCCSGDSLPVLCMDVRWLHAGLHLQNLQKTILCVCGKMVASLASWALLPVPSQRLQCQGID